MDTLTDLEKGYVKAFILDEPRKAAVKKALLALIGASSMETIAKLDETLSNDVYAGIIRSVLKARREIESSFNAMERSAQNEPPEVINTAL